MKNFDYQTPTRLIFGRDVVAGLPEVMRPFGRRILLTYGGGSIKRIGLYDRVKELLKDFEIFELGGIEPNPKYSTSVVEGVRICKEQQIDVISFCGWRFGTRLFESHCRRCQIRRRDLGLDYRKGSYAGCTADCGHPYPGRYRQ